MSYVPGIGVGAQEDCSDGETWDASVSACMPTPAPAKNEMPTCPAGQMAYLDWDTKLWACVDESKFVAPPSMGGAKLGVLGWSVVAGVSMIALAMFYGPISNTFMSPRRAVTNGRRKRRLAKTNGYNDRLLKLPGTQIAQIVVTVEEPGESPRYVTWKGPSANSIKKAARDRYGAKATLRFGVATWTHHWGAH